jgi:hypothetical protein
MTASVVQEQYADAFGFESDDLRMLADICYMAIYRGFLGQARAILDLLLILRPNSDATLVAEGLYWLAAGVPDTAIKKMRAAKPTDAIRALLGIALIRSGANGDGVEILSNLHSTGSEPVYRNAAATVLHEQELLQQMPGILRTLSLAPVPRHKAGAANGSNGAATLPGQAKQNIVNGEAAVSPWPFVK